MTSLFRKLTWWLQRRRKEDQLREELAFHLAEEADERQAAGLPAEQARWAARRDLGNATLLQEDTRALWTWTPLEQLAQDLRYGVRTMFRNRLFTALAALSLALGIGANTAIYSFMDSILLRSLPVSDPESLVVVKWRSKPINFGSNDSQFVLRSIDGTTYPDRDGTTAAIFPFPAFERLREVSAPVLSSLFAYHPAGRMNVLTRGEAELANGLYVSGDFFRGLAVPAAAGRLILESDDRAGAPLVAVISAGYSLRRFGGAAEATGQPVLVDNVPFTVIGVTPSGFLGVDPGAAPDVYLPLRTSPLFDPGAARRFLNQNYYWIQMMGRLRPGVGRAQAQAVLAGPRAVGSPDGGQRSGRATFRCCASRRSRWTRQPPASVPQPLYVLMAMVGLILAIACDTANLLLARRRAHARNGGAAEHRRRTIPAGAPVADRERPPGVLGGALGILVATLGIRVLTRLRQWGEGSRSTPT